MVKAGIAQKITAFRDPRLWRAAVHVGRIGRVLGGNNRLWDARVGYALRRAGQYGDAIDSYAAAIVGKPDAGWADVVSLGGHRSPANGVPAQWYYDLGACLARRKERDAAASVIRIACELEPDKIEWLEKLARLEEGIDNAYGRAWVTLRLADAHGDVDPQQRIELATQCDDLGLWLDAQHALAEGIRRDPDHAQSHKLLAKIASTSQLWGGTFTGGGLGTPGPLFQFGVAPLTQPSEAIERATVLNPSNTRWRAALGDALIASGDHAKALEVFDAALLEAHDSNERWALGVKQRWQFQLERCYHHLGKPRVSDPLFACTATPTGEQVAGPQKIAGLFATRLSYLGLTIRGLVTSHTADHVDIVVNGTTIRAVKTSDEGHFPRFTITLKRPTIALLPRDARLEVRTADGEPLRAPHGFERIDLRTPHGNGGLFDILAAGGKLTKKGRIGPSLEVVEERQLESLEIYAQLREFFQTRLGRDAFLMYGTLLGYHRDGDFIPSDDDFDAGYVSDQTNPRAVKQEAQDIIVDLVRAGFGVSFNWRGRLMRVHRPGKGTTGAHVDFRPLWFERGKVWAHNHLCMPASRDDVLPVIEGRLRGVPVLIPRNPEAFLLWQYGPGWRVPDPGFTYHLGDVDPVVRKHLSRALMTASEYRELLRRIEIEAGDSESAGKLVALGYRDLYPLK